MILDSRCFGRCVNINFKFYCISFKQFSAYPLCVRSLEITSSFAGSQSKGGDVWCPSLGDTDAAILQGTGELYFATTENMLRSVAILVKRVEYSVEQIFLGDFKKSKFLQQAHL
jgi:hypothetical protein